MELNDGVLTIEKEVSTLDERTFEFLDVLESVGIDYVVVSGYLLLLTGRNRMTEDVDVILAVSRRSELEAFAGRLAENGYVATPPPIERLAEFIQDSHVDVSKEGTRVPSFDLSLADTEIERLALEDSLTVAFAGRTIPVCPLEQQIAYKLYLAGDPREWKGTDFEDALHLYRVFGEQLNREEIEAYVHELDAEVAWDELRTT